MPTSPAGEAAEPSPGLRWQLMAPRLDSGAFSHELSVLLAAGIPMLEALSALREQSQQTRQPQAGAASAWIAGVQRRLKAGQALAPALEAALSEAGHAPQPLLIAGVAAAERSGKLPQALADHARHAAWVGSLRHQLASAALYPSLLVLASLAVLLFLLIVVVPRFAGLLEGRGGDLPLASQWLLAAGQAAAAQPLVTLALAAAVVLAPLVLWQLPAGRDALQALAWRLPSLGPRLRVLALAQLYRTLAMLLGAGVPVLAALRIAQGSAPTRLREALAGTAQSVAEGQRLSASLSAQGLATPVARRMLRVGERSGRLAEMLEQAAAFHDDELRRLGELVSRVVNPALMLVMGGLIGGLVVLLYLPIFQLAEGVL
ncbi:MAG: type II secretion system F family protein [Rubrivivax sp.]|jgi:general secretion pathway protein F|nr:type II secretion system F family protein [Rubrivivax sp.]